MYTFHIFGHKVSVENQQADETIHSEQLVIDMQLMGNVWVDPLSYSHLETMERGSHIDISV